ncbi:MAG TPA: IS6 family transposase, partial [Chitinophagaceae bacterium]|nr:IS6 family transposase [Chitinophagaceae bacterium]
YAPLLKNKLEWYQKRYSSRWHIDETYIRVKGEWKYLYRAIDERGNTLDFYLSKRRNTKAAKLFLQKLIKRNKDYCPSVINTDKNPAYNQAIQELKQEGLLSENVKYLQIKYRIIA